jgi:23S rRNA (uracil1939-C5)-methyltransferase
MSTPVQHGDTVTLDIEKFADEGKGLARVRGGLVVFVPKAVPGDRVRATVTKRAKSHAEAQTTELLEPSAKRTEPRCRYFGACGGCDWQHVRYREQARMKQQSVREALVHRGGFDEDTVRGAMRPIIEAERPYLYRNTMRFDFSDARWLARDEIDSGEDFDTGFALGLHAPGQPRKVLDLKECHLQSALSRRLVNRVRDFAKERGWAPQDPRRDPSRGDGFLHGLVIRQSRRTGGVLVALVTGRRDEESMDALAAFLQREFPDVTTFVNVTPGDEAAGAQHVHFGDGRFRERLGGFTFAVGPETFFQPNTQQAERLFEAARELADLAPTVRCYDLYCGAGALSLVAAEAAGEVVGIEGREASVEEARANAAAHDVANARFFSGAVEERFTEAFAEKHGRPDVLLADPPRAGMDERVPERIAALRPERVVYVSCDPQTQARDLKRLREATGGGAYRLAAVQPVDQFPQTAHVENVVALREA